MSIDAIGRVVAGVSALAASRTELATGNRGANSGQSPAADQSAAPADATIIAISEEAQARQQAAADQAAQDAAAAAAADQAAQAAAAADQAAQAPPATATSAVTNAVSNDWAAGPPTVDNAAVQEALDALDQASRENAGQAEQTAIQNQQDQNALEQKAVEDATGAAVQRQDDIVLAAINAGIRVAFGSLATPITGDPALREPGKVDIVA